MKPAQQAVSDLLAKTSFFGSLGDDGRNAVACHMRPAVFSAGQVIFLKDDQPCDLFVVRKGRVRLSILSSEGRELTLAHATAGDVFGEIALLDGKPRTANATALTEVDALSLSRSALQTLMETRPHIASAAIAFLCDRLRTTDANMEAIALYSIEMRLARFLLSAIQLQTQSPGKEQRLSLEMSQGELALLLGASRPKVNKALATLEEGEALRRDGAHLVCNVEMLKAYGGVE